MNTCSEIAIFNVPAVNIQRVIELSLLIFKEINAVDSLILSHEILQKTDDKESICWLLTWVNQAAVKQVAENWATLPNTRELETLVSDKVYYGHFGKILK